MKNIKKIISLIMLISTFLFFGCTTNINEVVYNEFDSTVLTLEDFSSDSKLFIPHFVTYIEIQGKSYAFLIDTGDRKGTLKISDRLLQEIEATPTGKKRSSKDMYGNKLYNHQYKVDGVKLGSVTIDNLLCEVTNDHWFEPFSDYKEYIGMIGWRLLKDFNFLFDYENSIIKLYPKGEIPEEIKTWDSLKLYESEVGITIRGSFEDNKNHNFILDSGGGSVALTEDNQYLNVDAIFTKYYKKALKTTTLKEDNLKIPYLQGDFSSGTVTIKDLKLGQIDAPWFLTYKYSGLLGWSFFRENSLFFDNQNNLLYVK